MTSPSPEQQERPTIYVASKTQHGAMWREKRAAGHRITASWIDESEAGQTTSWADLWNRCISEAGRAGVTILYREPGEVLKGALVEVGVALASGRRVFVVGDMTGYSWTKHPSVTEYWSVDAALEAAALLRSLPPERTDTAYPVEPSEAACLAAGKLFVSSGVRDAEEIETWWDTVPGHAAQSRIVSDARAALRAAYAIDGKATLPPERGGTPEWRICSCSTIRPCPVHDELPRASQQEPERAAYVHCICGEKPDGLCPRHGGTAAGSLRTVSQPAAAPILVELDQQKVREWLSGMFPPLPPNAAKLLAQSFCSTFGVPAPDTTLPEDADEQPAWADIVLENGALCLAVSEDGYVGVWLDDAEENTPALGYGNTVEEALADAERQHPLKPGEFLPRKFPGSSPVNSLLGSVGDTPKEKA